MLKESFLNSVDLEKETSTIALLLIPDSQIAEFLYFASKGSDKHFRAILDYLNDKSQGQSQPGQTIYDTVALQLSTAWIKLYENSNLIEQAAALTLSKIAGTCVVQGNHRLFQRAWGCLRDKVPRFFWDELRRALAIADFKHTIPM
jgi:hypothetical protein